MFALQGPASHTRPAIFRSSEIVTDRPWQEEVVLIKEWNWDIATVWTGTVR